MNPKYTQELQLPLLDALAWACDAVGRIASDFAAEGEPSGRSGTQLDLYLALEIAANLCNAYGTIAADPVAADYWLQRGRDYRASMEHHLQVMREAHGMNAWLLRENGPRDLYKVGAGQ